MKIYILVATLILAQTQLPQQPPPKFALLTVTHARDNSFFTFLNYLKHYTETQCYEDLISQICIIWNNDQAPEEIGALQRELFWRVPVYFYHTKKNSLNHRFRTPKQASADVFYSLDDDILADCQTLNQTFINYWNKKQPYPNRLVTNQVRSYGYMPDKKTQFFYQGQAYSQYFGIVQTGASFFPKHYLDLYYLGIQQLEKLRSKVDNMTSCEDIFFMAIAQHFYPQMIPQYYAPSKEYKNTDPIFGLSRKKGLIQLRTSCLTFLVDTLGYNPMRLFSKNASKYANNWKFNNIEIIMQTKIRGFGDVRVIENSERVQQKGDTQPLPKAASYEIAQFQQTDEIDEQKQQQKTEKTTPQHQQKKQPLIDLKTSTEPQEQTQKTYLQVVQHQQTKQSWIMINQFQLLVSLLLFVIFLLIICMIRLIKMYKQLKNQSSMPPLRQQQQDPIRISY